VNGCYELGSSQRSWTEAGQECQSLHKDAHLLVINDAREQAAVVNMLSQFTFPASCFLKTLDTDYQDRITFSRP